VVIGYVLTGHRCRAFTSTAGVALSIAHSACDGANIFVVDKMAQSAMTVETGTR